MTQYPRDEFDRVPESAARQGVHRERLVPPKSSGLALKVVAGILVLAVGLAAYFLFPRLGLGQVSAVTSESSSSAPMPSVSAEEAASEGPDEDSSAEPTPTESGSPSADPTPTDFGSPSTKPAPEENPTAEETESDAVVDREQPVAVLNATTVGGLASTAAGRLQGDGWNVTQIGNWSGQQLQGSIVFYDGEEQRATAEALAGTLGIGTVQGDAGFGNITVVVGPGFQ